MNKLTILISDIFFFYTPIIGSRYGNFIGSFPLYCNHIIPLANFVNFYFNIDRIIIKNTCDTKGYR